MHSFAVALQFLTRLPVPYNFSASDQLLGRSVLFYPLVGLLVGIVLALLALMLQGQQVGLVSALVLTGWVWLTGGLHLDGLADCADAWAGGLDNPKRSLEIMKDPAAGPVAVVVLVLVLLLKWTALTEMIDKAQWIALVLTPVIGRLAVMLLMISTPYIRQGGIGEKLVRNIPIRQIQVLCSLCFVIFLLAFGWLPVLLTMVILMGIRHLAMQRLGGVTGDVYGAAVEVTETGFLIATVFYG